MRGEVWLWRVLWFVGLAVLTVLLLRPEPAVVASEVLGKETEYPASKAVHVGAYAVLTLLLGLSRWPTWGTRVGLAVLLEHAVATEIGQLYVPGRVGSPIDVGFDHFGIGLGLLAAWLVCWRKPRASSGAGQVDDEALQQQPRR